MDKPNPLIHRFLISTTSRFTSCYEGELLRIDHAWLGPKSGLRDSIHENPRSRNYFVLSAEIEMPEKKSVDIPNYTQLAEHACAALSVLFGKRFDFHGRLVSHQNFYVPDLGPLTPTTYYEAAPYSHRPRQDLSIPLQSTASHSSPRSSQTRRSTRRSAASSSLPRASIFGRYRCSTWSRSSRTWT